jgi:hypothetical protein
MASLIIRSHGKISNTYTTVERKLFENGQLKDEVSDGMQTLRLVLMK